MANIGDVAKLAKVSKSTVSYVFSKKKYVSSDICKRVYEACEKLNYTPNFFASNLINNRSNIVGLFLEQDNPKFYNLYNDLIRSCTMELSKYGIQLLVYFNYNVDVLCKSLTGQASPIMGAIVITPNFLDKRILAIEKIKIPFVVLGKTKERALYDRCVDGDIRQLVRTLFLKTYQMGHRKYLFLNSSEKHTLALEREHYLREMVSEHPDMRIESYFIEKSEYTREILKEHLGENTCVALASDQFAKFVYEYAEEKNLLIPRDLSVFALGGDEYLYTLRPKLTSMHQDYVKIGELLSRQIIKLINDEKTEFVSFANDIIEGDSIAPV